MCFIPIPVLILFAGDLYTVRLPSGRLKIVYSRNRPFAQLHINEYRTGRKHAI